MTEEDRQKAIVQQTDIQSNLIANVEADIRVVKHKIDLMKEEYRRFDDDAEFADRLEELYGEMGFLMSQRSAMRQFPFNESSSTWDVSEINSDPNFAVGYDRLNRDL
tara:strand:- start:789 stop:1109 length:321 start_codon:yes stop_codon:yes gene_type:complete